MSMKNKYHLINPYIEGSLNTIVNASSPYSGGKKIYKNISSHFKNRVDNFYMTIQNIETKDLTHFAIKEKVGKNGSIDYKLDLYDSKIGGDVEKKLINAVSKINSQDGGRRHHKLFDDDSSSSSSESSSSDEYTNIRTQPISRFVYFHLPYYKLNLSGLTPIDAARFFLPTFNFPINPSIEIRFDLYKFY